ncbi:MAG: glycoside hydrolase family 5 protein, partial [Sphingobacteriaceae bacterium]
MKKQLILLVVFIFGVITADAQSRFISVKGKEIIGTNGKPMLLKGTNLGNWLVP